MIFGIRNRLGARGTPPQVDEHGFVFEIQNVVWKYFDPVIDAQLRGGGVNADSDALVRSAREDIYQRFHAVVSKRPLLPDGSTSARNIAYQLRSGGVLVGGWTMAELLAAAFSRSRDKVAQLVHSGLSPYTVKVVANVAFALQEVALSFPSESYSEQQKFPAEVVQVLVGVLGDLEELRRAARLPLLLDYANAISVLHTQVAKTNRTLWLPLRPVVTAALSGADLGLDARTHDSADQLARQVVRGDGVVLVTGQRGVGKSSFINSVLESRVPAVARQQYDDDPWLLVPIQISLARATSPSTVLRLCIRALYRTFADPGTAGQPTYSTLLRKEERDHLQFANLRASYKVNLQQADSLATLRQLEAALDFRPGGLLPKQLGGNLLPFFSKKWTTSRSTRLDQTIALLDYDEDSAEDDLLRAIKLLSKQRGAKPGSPRIKLVFVLDEMDKLEVVSEQLPIVSRLKNLLLARHAVFVLVTSREFYYLWMESRDQEDKVLASLFSNVITVPSFNAADTTRLLERLVVRAEGQFTPDETLLLADLAGYLTYQARGLPREIVREIQNMQSWVPNTLQAYLSDSPPLLRVYRIYAALQKVIELITDPHRSTDTSFEEMGTGPGAGERLLSDSGWREHVQWGMYGWFAEVLNEGVLEANGSAVMRIRASYFKHLSENQVRWLINRATMRIRSVRFTTDGSAEMVPLLNAIRSDDSAVPGDRWTVAPEFYTVTGRKATHNQEEQTAHVISGEDIAHWLGNPNRVNCHRAFAALGQLGSTVVTPALAKLLYRILIGHSDTAFRVKAAQYLSGDSVLRCSVDEGRGILSLLAEEPEWIVLRAFADVLCRSPIDPTSFDLWKACLLVLLSRFGSAAVRTGNEQGVRPTPDFEAFEAVLGSLVESGVRDLMELAAARLDAGTPLPPSLVDALLSCESLGDRHLLSLLLPRGYSFESSSSLATALKAYTELELPMLWTQARSAANSSLGLQVLANLLTMAKDPPDEFLVSWLSGEDWTLVDRQVLLNAGAEIQRRFHSAAVSYDGPGADRFRQRLDQLPSSESSDGMPPRSLRVRRAFVFLPFFIGVAWFFGTSQDLPESPTPLLRVGVRALQLISFILAVMGILRLGGDRPRAAKLKVAFGFWAAAGAIVAALNYSLPVTLHGEFTLLFIAGLTTVAAFIGIGVHLSD